MENSKVKNMIVLKNLPSNLVEEAFVVLKSNKNAKKLAKIEKKQKNPKKVQDKKEKDYVLKEAELLISEYIEKIESTKQLKKTIRKDKNYKSLKKYAYLSTVIMFIETLLLILIKY